MAAQESDTWLEISTRKLSKCKWFSEVASQKKNALAIICQYFSSKMSIKQKKNG